MQKKQAFFSKNNEECKGFIETVLAEYHIIQFIVYYLILLIINFKIQPLVLLSKVLTPTPVVSAAIVSLLPFPLLSYV